MARKVAWPLEHQAEKQSPRNLSWQSEVDETIKLRERKVPGTNNVSQIAHALQEALRPTTERNRFRPAIAYDNAMCGFFFIVVIQLLMISFRSAAPADG
jgi:hypothetical protein